MRKVLDSLVVASFLMSAAVLGSGVYGYFWITNEDNQKELMDSAVEKIKENLPIPTVPKTTGGALPF